jgi:Domain of unknown function (DUF4349)
MRPTVLTMPPALLLFLCFACNSGSHKGPVLNDVLLKEATRVSNGVVGSDSTAVATDKEEEPMPSPSQAPGQNKKQPAPPLAANPDWDKKIIKTADLDVEVKSFRTFSDRLRQNVNRSGGYIAQEQQTLSLASIENRVTIKVPADQFEDLIQQMTSDSDRLVEKKINSEDVTTQMVDTRSRLETKKEVRERYLELLRQAKNMKDILAVQDVINNVQEEMDAAAGRIAYLGHSAAFSTINLKFYQVLDASGKEDTSPSFWRKLRDSVNEGWDWMSSLVLGLASIWPLLLLGGLGWIIVRRRRLVGKTL